MARRIAQAQWSGELNTGAGEVTVGGERLGLAYTPAWLQEGAGTNPGELLAAAHAASFAMTLQAAFSRARHHVEVVDVRAELHLDRRDGAWTITRSDLECEVTLEKEPRTRDMSASEFEHVVGEAAAKCPVSCALAGVETTVDARQTSFSRGAASPSRGSRPIGDPHGERASGDGRQRRALEGQLVSRMRTQARKRRGSSPVAR